MYESVKVQQMNMVRKIYMRLLYEAKQWEKSNDTKTRWAGKQLSEYITVKWKQQIKEFTDVYTYLQSHKNTAADSHLERLLKQMDQVMRESNIDKKNHFAININREVESILSFGLKNHRTTKQMAVELEYEKLKNKDFPIIVDKRKKKKLF